MALEPIVDMFSWNNDMTDVNCKESQGKFIPIVDFSRCEAKGPCTQVCPFDVFEIRTIEPSDYAKLGLARRKHTGAAHTGSAIRHVETFGTYRHLSPPSEIV
jgi:NAD-dependent dihydropyrimidine dehydrogenase PreA subunit